MCVAVAETVDHLLRNCRYAKMLWTSILNLVDDSGPLPNSPLKLFEAWKMGVGFLGGREDKLFFLAIIWTIWKERNRCCFDF